jgi:5-hydroxyisourate hydrolase
MSSLSTHVLNTTLGLPAAGVALTLCAGDKVLFSGEAGADGRWRCPLDLEAGRYRLEFAIAAHFTAKGVSLATPPFFDTVGIDFNLAKDSGHYHVPLLVSPYGYSTYRGS